MKIEKNKYNTFFRYLTIILSTILVLYTAINVYSSDFGFGLFNFIKVGFCVFILLCFLIPLNQYITKTLAFLVALIFFIELIEDTEQEKLVNNAETKDDDLDLF